MQLMSFYLLELSSKQDTKYSSEKYRESESSTSLFAGKNTYKVMLKDLGKPFDSSAHVPRRKLREW